MDYQPLILLIDTSTTVCSVALSKGGRVLDCLEDEEPNVHASKLTLMIAQLMERHQLHYPDLAAIAVAKGPGSYTGLRIGVSVAKGLCYALGIPLIAIDSLLALARGFQRNDAVPSVQTVSHSEKILLCPMIDARRMEVYCAVYSIRDGLLETIRPTQALVIDNTSFDFLSEGQQILLFGTGADKLKDLFREQVRVQVVSGVSSSAKAMTGPAAEAYHRGDFVDLAYFEPLYLKDFIPTEPKYKP